MYISKKELLQETGISYGQLYRWKREGLIPESWFIKKSSYTGQETFFLRDKIIERIRSIQDLKDKYSLDELARLLSPEANSELYIMEEQMASIIGVEETIYHMYKRVTNIENMRFFDFILVMAFSNVQTTLLLQDSQVERLLENCASSLGQIGSMDSVIVVVEVNGDLLTLVLKESEFIERNKKDLQLYFDQRIKIQCTVSLNEVNEQFRKQNKNLF